jgi:hypothetical protein
VFIYKTSDESFIKGIFEENLNTVDRASVNTETFVNASFAIQGIQQMLSDHRLSTNVIEGGWRLCESAKLLLSLTLLLNVEEEEDEEDGEEDAHADDKKANIILDLMMFIFSGRVQHFRESVGCLLTTEDGAISLIEALKRSLTEEHTIAKYLACLVILCENPENIELLKNAAARVGMNELLGCASRFHRGNDQIISNCDLLRPLLA